MANQAAKKRLKDNAAFRLKFLLGLLVAQVIYVFHRGFLFTEEAFDRDFLQAWGYYLLAYAVMLFWLLSAMSTEHYKVAITSGWTGVCFDSMVAMATVQVLSFVTSYALYLLYIVPVFGAMQAIKVCLAAKKMLGGLSGAMGGGGDQEPDEAELKRRAKKERQQEMRERRAGRR